MDSIIVSRYSQEDKYHWDDFVRVSKNGWFLFERNYMDYHSDRFTDNSLIFRNHKGKTVAVFPAHISDANGKKELISHGGLTYGGLIYGHNMSIIHMGHIIDSLIAFCEAEQFVSLVVKNIPYYYSKEPAQEDLYFMLNRGFRVIRTDVSSVIDLHNGFNPDRSRRRGIKSAIGFNLEVRETEDYQTFMAIVESRLSNKYQVRPTHTAAELELLHGRFPENIRLFGVYDEDSAMICGGVFYISETVVNAQYIFARPEFLEKNAIDLLVSTILKQHCGGKRYFNYGISTTDQGRNLNEALISKKEGFGSRAAVHLFLERKF